MPSDRRYAAQSAQGNVQKALERIPDATARRLQHNKLIANAITTFDEFTLAGIRVVPTSPVHIDQETKMVEVRCFLFDAVTGQEIEHPDGRFQFDRPPYRVHDGTWRKEDDRILPNFKENALQAFRNTLVMVILSAIGREVPEEIAPREAARYVTDSLGFRITTSGKVVYPPQVDGKWQPYGDPPPGESWKELE